MPDPVLVLAGGDVLDPTGRRRADVIVGSDGTILDVGPDLDRPSGARVLDCADAVVTPGFVDLHSHLREPGKEEAETIETGSRAAVAGGYTCVLAMPNTTPPIDEPGVVRAVADAGRRSLCDVKVSACITVGRAGEQLTAMAELAAAGARWFTDDGDGVQDDGLMRNALTYAAQLGVVLAQHCENDALSGDGVMHEGEVSARLGLPGQPAEAEELMVMRDVALCRMTGARVHFMHCSTAGTVAMIRAAKAAGLPVTAEVTAHHLSLTDEACASYDATFKVHPPLRTEADVEACRAGLADGTLDCVATDHAPHTAESKERSFLDAPPGMLGLEQAFGVVHTDTDLTLEQICDRMSWSPARLLGVTDRHGGPVAAGRPANLAVLDPAATVTVDRTQQRSRSANTPFHGRTLTGMVRHTISNGEAVLADQEVTR